MIGLVISLTGCPDPENDIIAGIIKIQQQYLILIVAIPFWDSDFNELG